MGLMHTTDFIEMGKEAAQKLDSGKKLSRSTREELKLKKVQAEICAKVVSNIGSFFVDNEQHGKVAACVELDTKRIHMSLKTLDPRDESWAIYAGWHEKEHTLNGISEIKLEKDLSSDHVRALKEVIDTGKLLDEVAVMEGFNDLSTIRKHGKHHKSGYLREEVPFAEQLEKACKEKTGMSLMEAFRAGNKGLLLYRVRKMADLKLTQDALNKLSGDKEIINDLKATTKWQIPAVRDRRDAEKAVRKLYEDRMRMKQIRQSLKTPGSSRKKPANDNYVPTRLAA